jgi:hypothetical protein
VKAMGMIKQYHTRIVNGYKLLHIPVLYSCPTHDITGMVLWYSGYTSVNRKMCQIIKYSPLFLLISIYLR